MIRDKQDHFRALKRTVLTAITLVLSIILSATVLLADTTDSIDDISLEVRNAFHTLTINNSDEVRQGRTSTYTLTPPSAATGYHFSGWNLEGGGSLNGNTYTFGTEDGSVTGNVAPNTYKISYVLNSGTHGTSHPTSATFDKAFTVSNPSRTDYTFGGWTLSGNNTSTTGYSASGTTYKNLTATNGGTVTFTAKWTAQTASFTVHWINRKWSKGEEGNYSDAYGTPKAAGTSDPKTRTLTYVKATDSWASGSTPPSTSTESDKYGAVYIKRSNGAVGKYAIVGWSTKSDNKWRSDNTSDVTKNPSEYTSLTAAVKANYTGTLYAVYKRDGANYYFCAK